MNEYLKGAGFFVDPFELNEPYLAPPNVDTVWPPPLTFHVQLEGEHPKGLSVLRCLLLNLTLKGVYLRAHGEEQ